MATRFYKKGTDVVSLSDETYALLGSEKSNYVALTPTEIAALPTKPAEAAPVYTNPAGGNTSGGAVSSVNGQTGAVVLPIPTKMSTLTNDSGYQKQALDSAHLSNLTQFGKKKTVRMMYTGTSLANNGNSGARAFLGGLYNALGDSGNRTESFGYLGGGYVDPVNGWKKQRYGGFGLGRLRGEPTSTALSFTRYFSRYVLRYSTETTGNSFDVYVDGVKNQTVNCQGAQSYGNEAVIMFATPGTHTVELRPPATGFAFIESQDFCLDQPGLHVLDGSLGGSAVAQMVQVSAAVGNQVASIPVEGTNGGFASNGIDAVYNNTKANTKPDAIVFMYSVNDAGAGLGIVNSIFKPAVSYLVQKSYENNQQLIIIIEMGGHYSLPSYGTYSAFQEVRNFLLTFANRSHVTLFDWHEQSGLNTTDYDELVRLGNRYYPVVGLTKANAQANSGWSGDFIHPAGLGNAILSEMMLSRFGLMPVGRQDDELEAIVNALQPRTEMVSPAKQPGGYSELYNKLRGITRSDVNQIGIPGRYTHVGVSQNLASGRNEPLYQSAEELNYLTNVNDDVLAANTSDKYGAFKKYESSGPLGSYVPMHSLGGKATLTLVIGPGQYGIQVRNDGNSTFLPVSVQGATVNTFGFVNGVNSQNTPQVIHITIDNVPGVFYWTFTGILYGGWATLTDVPVIATKRVDKPSGLSQSLLLNADIAVSKIRVGQHYFEQVNGKSIEKAATEGIVYKPFAVGNKLFGLYRLRDKTSCFNQVFRLNGTVTFGAFSESLGGITQVSSDNPQVFACPVAINNTYAGKTLTIVGTPASAYIKIQLYNGGINEYMGLKADGTWVNNGGNDGAAPSLLDGITLLAGRPMAVTVNAPATAMFKGGDWEMRVYVEFNKPQPGFWHVCEGSLATI